MLRYSLVAGVLGIGWFAVLFIPGAAREWLLSDAWLNLLALAATSMLVAVAARRFIVRAETFAGHLTRAIVLPYTGCVLFLSLWAAGMWLHTLLSGGLANLHDTLSLYAMGMTIAAASFFVVVPYGLICQYVLHKVSGSRPVNPSC